ncbi:hypothetical protein AYO38_11815 [bacterium SCGC AG-212-C10]|nr:hypothetical protein AYO38_11815 [bacterium SCGC AG-212-C10]
MLHVGIDASQAGLVAASTAAARQAKGGRENALFVRAAVESLPAELCGMAAEITVLLPWGSLLAAVATPEVDALRGIRAMAAEGALLTVVFSHDATRDGDSLVFPDLNDVAARAALVAAYGDAGWRVDAVEAIDSAGIRAIGTTWAKKLASRPGRSGWRVCATAMP